MVKYDIARRRGIDHEKKSSFGIRPPLTRIPTLRFMSCVNTDKWIYFSISPFPNLFEWFDDSTMMGCWRHIITGHRGQL